MESPPHRGSSWTQSTSTARGRITLKDLANGYTVSDESGAGRNMRGPKTWIGIMFAGALACAHGQWLNYPAPGAPRTRDGEPNLSAPAPRASNGKPDLSGRWQGEPAPAGEIERLLGDISF